MGQTDVITMYKKLRSYQISELGSQILLDSKPGQGLMLVDIIISKAGDGRVTLQATDGVNTVPLLFIDKPGTQSFTFPKGLRLWRGVKIECIKDTEGLSLITIGYVNIHTSDWSVWSN